MDIISRIKLIRRIIIGCYFVLGWFLLLSLGCELLYNQSFTSLTTEFSCPSFLRAHVILEIMKIVGFTNVFLGFFYANLDKKIIGLSYSEILDFFFPQHHIFTILHIIFTITCIGLSAGGLSESAVISFVLVINGFVYQWTTLYFIVLNDNYCEKLAVYIWENDPERRRYPLILDSIFCITTNINDNNSKHYIVNLDCFCSLLIEYVKEDSDLVYLEDVSKIWGNLLRNHNNKNSTILADVFEKVLLKNSLNSTEIKERSACEIISGYMVFRIYNSEDSANDDCIANNFKILVKEIWSLLHFLSNKIQTQTKEYKAFTNCVLTNIYLLAWILFQYRVISLSQEFITYVPTEVNDNYIDKIAYILLRPIAKDQSSIKQAIDIAKKQLKHKISEIGDN